MVFYTKQFGRLSSILADNCTFSSNDSNCEPGRSGMGLFPIVHLGARQGQKFTQKKLLEFFRQHSFLAETTTWKVGTFTKFVVLQFLEHLSMSHSSVNSMSEVWRFPTFSVVLSDTTRRSDSLNFAQKMNDLVGTLSFCKKFVLITCLAPTIGQIGAYLARLLWDITFSFKSSNFRFLELHLSLASTTRLHNRRIPESQRKHIRKDHGVKWNEVFFFSKKYQYTALLFLASHHRCFSHQVLSGSISNVPEVCRSSRSFGCVSPRKTDEEKCMSARSCWVFNEDATFIQLSVKS